MEWAAFENVYGPLLPHDRIDVGFAKVCYYLVTLMASGKRRRFKLRDFLPGWITDRMQQAQTDEKQLEAMLQFWASADQGAGGNSS